MRGGMRGTVAAGLILLSASGHAQGVCGAGRHLGSENGDGAGMSWQCLPGGGGGSRGGVASFSGGRTGAALAGAGTIISIIGALAGMIDATDANTSAEQDRERERQSYAVQSRQANRSAMLAMQGGRFDEAEHLFGRASTLASRAGDSAGSVRNFNNARIAGAENFLQQGLRQERRGDVAAASHYYMQAKYLADSAGADELGKQIAGHNDRLIASSSGARAAADRGVYDTQTECAYINMRLICH